MASHCDPGGSDHLHSSKENSCTLFFFYSVSFRGRIARDKPPTDVLTDHLTGKIPPNKEKQLDI